MQGPTDSVSAKIEDDGRMTAFMASLIISKCDRLFVDRNQHATNYTSMSSTRYTVHDKLHKYVKYQITPWILRATPLGISSFYPGKHPSLKSIYYEDRMT